MARPCATPELKLKVQTMFLEGADPTRLVKTFADQVTHTTVRRWINEVSVLKRAGVTDPADFPIQTVDPPLEVPPDPVQVPPTLAEQLKAERKPKKRGRGRPRKVVGPPDPGKRRKNVLTPVPDRKPDPEPPKEPDPPFTGPKGPRKKGQDPGTGHHGPPDLKLVHGQKDPKPGPLGGQVLDIGPAADGPTGVEVIVQGPRKGSTSRNATSGPTDLDAVFPPVHDLLGGDLDAEPPADPRDILRMIEEDSPVDLLRLHRMKVRLLSYGLRSPVPDMVLMAAVKMAVDLDAVIERVAARVRARLALMDQEERLKRAGDVGVMTVEELEREYRSLDPAYHREASALAGGRR